MVKPYITEICFLYLCHLSIASLLEDESKSTSHLLLNGIVRESIQNVRVLTKSKGKKETKVVKESKGKRGKVKKDKKSENSFIVDSGGEGGGGSYGTFDGSISEDTTDTTSSFSSFSSATATELPSITCDESDERCLIVQAAMSVLFKNNEAIPDERNPELLNLADIVSQRHLEDKDTVCTSGSHEEKKDYGCDKISAKFGRTDTILKNLHDATITTTHEEYDGTYGLSVYSSSGGPDSMDCW
eukprot:CAMPEP_0194274300 /NCGR_PEP_ID=MMETSP0169-20130528/7404_1 /TAXON_ID=218684 /ORGANISM="Corethron pennatum, Strain L29A3" /LENGTH=242 /DNA_ID=CAMNT_0039017451 /DNA_START=154 /DNA_END=879 /DNA_ORIENTATION=-